MAKISNIKTAAQGILNDAVIGISQEDFEELTRVDAQTGLIGQLEDRFCLDQNFSDRLGMLDGELKEYGDTIEEYGWDLIVPEATPTITSGQSYGIPYRKVSIEGAYYSQKLPQMTAFASTSAGKYKSSMRNVNDWVNYTSEIVKVMHDSYNQCRYEEKKELLGIAATDFAVEKEAAVPVDESTGTAFIKNIKFAAEEASFARDITIGSGDDAHTYVLGAAPELVLFIKKGIMPVVEVETLAGAFNKEDLALNVKTVVVDDFGSDDDHYALLADPRAIKLFVNRNDVGLDVNNGYDYATYSRHFTDTPFIAKFATLIAFKAPATNND